MDGCSWLPFQSGGGTDHGAASERSCRSELQQGQDLPISSQVEDDDLQQIYLLMDMEEHGHAAKAPSPQSSAFHSYFSASPEEASSLMPGASTNTNNTTTNFRNHTPDEVSSLKITLSSPFTYRDDRNYGHCYGNGNLGTIPTLQEFTCQKEAYNDGRSQRKNGHGGAGAFMPYSRHLSPKKKPKPGYGGQRAIKAAMSALARMHMVRIAQWRQHYQTMGMAEVAPPTGSGSNGNQLQHVLSERKRREKLNDSFKALRTVLPPAPKKDKASILIRARDYVNTLKSRVSELEERNRILVAESQRHCNNGVDPGDVSDEDVEVNIDRATAGDISQEFQLKIVVRSGCNAMDAVVGILECLKETGDVRLAAVDTGSTTTTLTLQLKTRRCDDNFLKESVIKSVKGVMQSKIETA